MDIVSMLLKDTLFLWRQGNCSNVCLETIKPAASGQIISIEIKLKSN